MEGLLSRPDALETALRGKNERVHLYQVSFASMEKLAIGFWGSYFGTAALMLVFTGLAFCRSLHRIALHFGIAVMAASFYAFAFLGGLPIRNPDTLAHLLAHVSTLTACLLAYLLLSMLGLLRARTLRWRMRWALGNLAALLLVAGALLSSANALMLSLAATLVLACVGFVMCLRNAVRGDRMAWTALAGLACLMVSICGFGWIALDRADVPWQVHAATALAATAYLCCMAAVLWTRYSYLIELNRIMAQGSRYDPVTRMRSHSETGQLVGAVFQGFRDQPAPLGVMVLTVANLYALEKLHGQAALNHALYVCAGRLRRSVPGHIEMGRLGDDGFLLLMRHCSDTSQLVRLAQNIQARLSKSVVLSTKGDVSQLETDTMSWTAEVGIGVLIVSQPEVRGPAAIAMGRGMSRTAMSFPSRIACYDKATGQIAELRA